MKRMMIIILLLVLAACGKEDTISTLLDPTPDQKLDSTAKDVSLLLNENIFLESPLIINTVMKNNSLKSYRYGEFYSIEINKEDQWYIVVFSDAIFYKNPRFINTGSILHAGEEVHQQFHVDDLGTTLPPGEYRLVKTLITNEGPLQEIIMAVPFTVK